MPSQETTKCRYCGLNQYMTINEMCRRCKKPLTLFKFLDVTFPVWRESLPIATMHASNDLPRTNFAKQLGQKIKSLRKVRGLRREDLSHIMLSSSLSRVENGAHYPSVSTLEKFADALHVPIAELLPHIAVTYEMPDHFVDELSLYLRVIPWDKWIEIIATMKALMMRSGVSSLQIRASLERQYCQEARV